mmetsp:Transcript_1356/g.5827  ORF Transcript_1356/g.5827 Transcript_1356/m.5827 type:complete len:80 (+) Transcript_1356:2975-3214(+)
MQRQRAVMYVQSSHCQSILSLHVPNPSSSPSQHLMIEFLWQNGANLDVLNDTDQAPLELATEGAHGQAISLLLQKLEVA